MNKKLLVAASANFGQKSLLRDKLNLYVGTLADFDVVAVNDQKGMIREYFSDRRVSLVSPSISMSEKRKICAESSWAVFFLGWD